MGGQTSKTDKTSKTAVLPWFYKRERGGAK